MSNIHEILGQDGLLSKFIKNFEHRPGQIQMAELVQEAIDRKMPAIVESGTGTGKTLSYLVPAILSGKKIVISTGTKNLQEQIFLKDIPMLYGILGHEIDAVLVKGRGNYLCLNKFERMEDSITKTKVRKWIDTTEFADLAEIDLDKGTVLSSSTNSCLGSKCPYRDQCFVNKLREKAYVSQIIITNHSLFFADMAIRADGLGRILPPYQVAILDEAHNVE